MTTDFKLEEDGALKENNFLVYTRG